VRSKQGLTKVVIAVIG